MILDEGKPFYRARSADQSVLAYVKFNHNLAGSGILGGPVDAADAAVTAATMEVAANSVLFTVNGSAETLLGTYTGNSGADNEIVFADANIASIQNLIDAINGVAAGQTSPNIRWRAGLGDFRPQFVIGAGDGLVTAAANALVGRHHDGVPITADSSGLASANAISVGIGTPSAREGAGSVFPDHFESDYTVTTAGTKTPVRNAARKIASQPGFPHTRCLITDIQVAALFATTKVVTVYDNAGNTLASWSIGAATAIPGSGNFTKENPAVIGPPGSPLFVEVTGSGGFTDGVVGVSGYFRAA